MKEIEIIGEASEKHRRRFGESSEKGRRRFGVTSEKDWKIKGKTRLSEKLSLFI